MVQSFLSVKLKPGQLTLPKEFVMIPGAESKNRENWDVWTPYYLLYQELFFGAPLIAFDRNKKRKKRSEMEWIIFNYSVVLLKMNLTIFGGDRKHLVDPLDLEK